MPEDTNNTHDEMLKLLRENNDLIKQNHELLKKIHRFHIAGITLRVLWYAVLIGLPFALYFYVLEPYFQAFGANYDVFMQGMAEIPGLKGLEQLFPSGAQ